MLLVSNCSMRLTSACEAQGRVTSQKSAAPECFPCCLQEMLQRDVPVLHSLGLVQQVSLPLAA